MISLPDTMGHTPRNTLNMELLPLPLGPSKNKHYEKDYKEHDRIKLENCTYQLQGGFSLVQLHMSAF